MDCVITQKVLKDLQDFNESIDIEQFWSETGYNHEDVSAEWTTITVSQRNIVPFSQLKLKGLPSHLMLNFQA